MESLKEKKFISDEDYFKLSNNLIEKHSLFYRLWLLGKPGISNSIETACVLFNESGDNIDYLFNIDFWNKLDDYERTFVICHEFLHVILEHGVRILDSDKKDEKLCNVALDIVVNHLLVEKFDFDRDKISFADTLCWEDTVLGKDFKREAFFFEYYFNLLKKKQKNINIKPSFGENGDVDGFVIFDDHDKYKFFVGKDDVMESVKEGMSKEEIENLNERLNDLLSQEKNNENKNGNKAGTFPGSSWFIASTEVVKKKKKWETVIKKWSLNFKKRINEYDYEQWAVRNRRIHNLSEDLFLPSEIIDDNLNETKDKIPVWFFQDTSGSCTSYANRFFKAAKTLNPKRFDISMFCFDTMVYETSLQSGRLYGFGGTSFSCIERYIQERISSDKKIKYPKSVFVITDGYGDNVYPQYPKLWYWFLTSSCYYCIPKESNKYLLSNYE